jgi:brefeldin A-inhibited guanine nucleotide-exchange protein
MATSTMPLGGASPSGRVLGPALDRIIKNAAWRKHSALVAAAKAALDLLSSSPAYPSSDPISPQSSLLLGLPSAAADAALHALLLALESASPKVVDPALDCVTKLLYHRLLFGDLGCAGDDASSPTSRLFTAVLTCGALSDDAMELATLRVIIAAARCPTVAIRGEGLGQVLKTCYNIYLSSNSGANQLCAKLALAQVLLIVFARVEVDSMDVRIRTVSITEMMDVSDRNLNDSSIVQVAQGFINETMEGSVAPEPGSHLEPTEVDGKEDTGMSKIREDGLALLKNLCKLSMKFSTPDNPEDQMLLRGKVLSLELLKMVIDNAGPFWRTNEKYDPVPVVVSSLVDFNF